jgi:hypothetical protein
MTPEQEVEYILDDCFYAVGQAVGTRKQLDFDAIVWWRDRYRHKFLQAMRQLGNAWTRDRRRVLAVGRFLGQRALHHSGDGPVIDVTSAAKASADVETGCGMNAELEQLVLTRDFEPPSPRRFL